MKIKPTALYRGAYIFFSRNPLLEEDDLYNENLFPIIAALEETGSTLFSTKSLLHNGQVIQKRSFSNSEIGTNIAFQDFYYPLCETFQVPLSGDVIAKKYDIFPSEEDFTDCWKLIPDYKLYDHKYFITMDYEDLENTRRLFYTGSNINEESAKKIHDMVYYAGIGKTHILSSRLKTETTGERSTRYRYTMTDRQLCRHVECETVGDNDNIFLPAMTAIDAFGELCFKTREIDLTF